MEQNFLLILAVAVLTTTQMAMAQNDPKPLTVETNLAAEISLHGKVSSCINNPSCSLADRIQLMEEMQKDLQSDMQKMKQTCVTKNYLNCIGPEYKETRNWHRTQNDMTEMMLSMETNYSNQGEPAKFNDENGWQNWFRADKNR